MCNQNLPKKTLLNRAKSYAQNNPFVAKILVSLGSLAMITQNVAAATMPAGNESSSWIGIDATQIDSLFHVLNHTLLPNVGKTISALPAIIIPIVILVVLMTILFFVPEILYGFLSMLKSAMKIRK